MSQRMAAELSGFEAAFEIPFFLRSLFFFDVAAFPGVWKLESSILRRILRHKTITNSFSDIGRICPAAEQGTERFHR